MLVFVENGKREKKTLEPRWGGGSSPIIKRKGVLIGAR